MHGVFVYGTLRRGERNHALLARAKFRGTGTTAEKFTLVDLGAYPAVITGPSAGVPTPIRGEVYAVDDATLADLDRLESCPGFYSRRHFTIHLDKGPVISAWMYFLTTCDQPATPIPSGNWLQRTSPSEPAKKRPNPNSD